MTIEMKLFRENSKYQEKSKTLHQKKEDKEITNKKKT